MATVQKKTVLITGCSTGGIGWAMVKRFHERGFHVFATARDPSKAADLSELSNVEILELDVTVPQTILQCKDTVAKRTGGKLDVLVNNAGVEFVSPLLDVDVAGEEAVRRQRLGPSCHGPGVCPPADRGQGSRLQPELH